MTYVEVGQRQRHPSCPLVVITSTSHPLGPWALTIPKLQITQIHDAVLYVYRHCTTLYACVLRLDLLFARDWHNTSLCPQTGWAQLGPKTEGCAVKEACTVTSGQKLWPGKRDILEWLWSVLACHQWPNMHIWTRVPCFGPKAGFVFKVFFGAN